MDRLLALAEKRQLREFQDGLAFIRAKRDPSPEHLSAWRDTLDARVRQDGLGRCIAPGLRSTPGFGG